MRADHQTADFADDADSPFFHGKDSDLHIRGIRVIRGSGGA
jgi:hypothetical protein